MDDREWMDDSAHADDPGCVDGVERAVRDNLDKIERIRAGSYNNPSNAWYLR